MESVLVPISIFLGTFAMVFGIRYLSNKEKMAMIERGIHPGVSKSAPKPYLSLKFGLLMVGLGIGLLVALFTVIGVFGGLGLITSFIIEKKAIDKETLK